MSYKEELLHYVWRFRLYPVGSLETTDGQKIEVIDPGIGQSDAGPDFFNAKIRIGGKLWAGDVEIHCSSDEWMRHEHHLDKAYNAVILHVVGHASRVVVNERGYAVPQCELKIPDKIIKNADYLIRNSKLIPCRDFIPFVPSVSIRSFLAMLAVERLERKTNDIYVLLDRFRQSWDEAFYVLLSRSFGFGLNSDAFERLASSLPYKYVQRHGNNLFQVEALLFGQAGILDDMSLNHARDEYFLRLREEYQFLRHKYSLTPLEGYLFKRMRTRPRSFPTMRIAQLAALLQSSDRLFSRVIEGDSIQYWDSLFLVSPSVYWQNHYSFGNQSVLKDARLGNGSRESILINTVAPVLFAYGRKVGIDLYCDKAIHLLEAINAEKNAIVRGFNDVGILSHNAFESQALIQLRKMYCDSKKCLFCRIGHVILSKREE